MRGERPDAGSRDTYTLIQVELGWAGSAISISFLLPPPLCEMGNQGNLQCNVAEEENGGPTSPTPGAEIISISLSRVRRVSPTCCLFQDRIFLELSFSGESRTFSPSCMQSRKEGEKKPAFLTPPPLPSTSMTIAVHFLFLFCGVGDRVPDSLKKYSPMIRPRSGDSKFSRSILTPFVNESAHVMHSKELEWKGERNR